MVTFVHNEAEASINHELYELAQHEIDLPLDVLAELDVTVDTSYFEHDLKPYASWDAPNSGMPGLDHAVIALYPPLAEFTPLQLYTKQEGELIRFIYFYQKDNILSAASGFYNPHPLKHRLEAAAINEIELDGRADIAALVQAVEKHLNPYSDIIQRAKLIS